MCGEIIKTSAHAWRKITDYWKVKCKQVLCKSVSEVRTEISSCGSQWMWLEYSSITRTHYRNVSMILWKEMLWVLSCVYFSFQIIHPVQKNSPAVKKGKVKNAQVTDYAYQSLAKKALIELNLCITFSSSCLHAIISWLCAYNVKLLLRWTKMISHYIS